MTRRRSAPGWLASLALALGCMSATNEPEPAAPTAPSIDDEVSFRAVTTLADVHDPSDLEPVLRAYLARRHRRTGCHRAHDDLHHVLGVRLRDWRDRRAVVALVELLDGPSLVAENAAESLAQSPGVPSLDAEPTTAEGATHTAEGVWVAPPSSRVAPYRRWWDQTGRAAFAAECASWVALAAASRAVCEAR